MDICQVETGLLKKKPCGQPGVTHCLNCEQALCSKHAVPLVNEGGHKTGKFMCQECFAAQKEAAKLAAKAPPAAKKAEAPAPAPKPAAPAPAAAKTAALAQAKPEPKKPDMDDSGPLEFTPTKK